MDRSVCGSYRRGWQSMRSNHSSTPRQWRSTTASIIRRTWTISIKLAGHPDLAAKPLDQILKDLAKVPDQIRTAVRNNGGGHANHSLFWQTLGKNKGPAKGKLKVAIDKSFGSQSALDDKLRATGLTVFGSGWVWVTPKGKDELMIETSPNQDSPWMAGHTPLFGIDVWEHAYYLKYQNRRADYLAAVVQVVNWDFVSARYEDLTK